MSGLDSLQHQHIEQHLMSNLSALKKNEPLDPTYESLLPVQYRRHAKVAAASSKTDKEKSIRKNTISSDVTKLHKRLNANLREKVESFASTPAGWGRKPHARRIETDFGSSSGRNSKEFEEVDSKLRAAFSLRDSKEHEQLDLVNATLKAHNAKLRRGWGFSSVSTFGNNTHFSAGGGAAAAANPMALMLPPLEQTSARKKWLNGIASQLRDAKRGSSDRVKLNSKAERARYLIMNPESANRKIIPDAKSSLLAESGREAKRAKPDPEMERLQKIEEAKAREISLRERVAKEEEENKRQIELEREEQQQRERALETPRDALHRLYHPIFTALWDMEFEALGGTNPFRMVIDADNCSVMGVPDYCSVIEKPMNLTFVQAKVNNKTYETLSDFLTDINLVVTNAMKYNSDPKNPYHVAAKALGKRCRKLVKPLLQSLKKGNS